MGYDIYAYFDVNQDQIEAFIQAHQLDRTHREGRKRIVEYYQEQHPELNTLSYMGYSWNKKCEIHVIYASIGTNFIRDDERLYNRLYHRVLAEKHQRPFPDCLTDINMYLRSSKVAIEISDELTVFFGHDEQLMGFADWLKLTAKYCAIYDLSR